MRQLAVKNQSDVQRTARPQMAGAASLLSARISAPPFFGPIVQKNSHCACGGGCPRCQSTLPIQTKLAVSEPGDVYEQAADRVAGEVMRMTAPLRHQDADGFTQPQDLAVQRECAQCEKDEEFPQKKEPPGQAGPVPDDSQDVPPVVHEVLRSPGQPIDAATRAFFEPRFGHDFSHVRVHADAKAAESARAVNAVAYTVGRDVVFEAGQYAPRTSAGRQLLAHELTHVAQQGRGAIQSKAEIIQRGAFYEQEADQVAGAVMDVLGSHAPITRAYRQLQVKFGTSEKYEGTIQRKEKSDSADAFPLINVEFAANPGQPQRCCTCGTPPCASHLGPAVVGDITAQNGMNLVATILHTIASSAKPLDYGFVQTVQSRQCLEHLPALGGGWVVTDQRPAGSNDVFDPCATCTTPQVRDSIPEIVFADAPGLRTRLRAPAFGNQLMQKANLQTWVIARESRGPWRRISEPFRWHSVSWVRRDIAGNWELNPGHNEIGPGWTRFGAGCPA